MADPTTIITAVQLVATVGETISSIGRAVRGSRDAEAEAESIRAQTAISQRQERKQNRRIIAKQQNLAAGSGLDVTSGTPLEQTLSSAFEGELNALNIGFTGNLRRQAKLREARDFRQSIPSRALGGIFKGASVLGDMFIKGRSRQTGLGPTVGQP